MRLAMLLLIATFGAQVLAPPPVMADGPAPRIVAGDIGFDGTFKVGHWTPVIVGLNGNVKDAGLVVRVTTADNDGVAMSIETPLPLDADSSEGIWPARLYTRVGRFGAGVQVALVGANGNIFDRRELAMLRPEADAPLRELPATGQLIVQLGRGKLGFAEALVGRQIDDDTTRAVVGVGDVDRLPGDWYGYDGVDVLVLATNDLEFCQRLASDARRFAALERWVELGGRLVICGGRHAPQLLAAEKPFAAFVPGRYVGQLRLPQTRTVESYAGSALPLHSGPTPPEIFVPHFADVRGRVELFGQADALPLVVRTPYGLGEVTFVALDLDAPQVADWAGRAGLLRAVMRPYVEQELTGAGPQTLVSLGYDDLAGALRQRLGRRFIGVKPITFPIVACTVIAYLLVLGPLDYFFVEKLAGRRWIAWVTFPLIVFATCTAAVWAARAAKHIDVGRLNVVELVDIDLSSGAVRGTSWSALYTADARRFDVRLEPELLDVPVEADAQLASLGLPGSGIGGMHARGMELDVTQTSYRTSPDLKQLEEVPVLTAATKSFLARWNATLPPDGPILCEASLSLNEDGLLVGTLTNRTGQPLRNACLLHGQWGYAIGNLANGERIEVGPQRRANRTRTIVLRRAGLSVDDSTPGRSVFLADQASLDELLNVMMFYEAAGGYGFAGLPNRYQAFCDMSRLIGFDRAVLVANCSAAGSVWMDTATGEPLALQGGKNPRLLTYRFVFPIDDGPRTTDE